MSSRTRTVHVIWTLVRHGLRGIAHGSVDGRRTGIATELRLAFEELGPTFIKLGQLMSVRPDLFGSHLVFELERLQDQVPTVPASVIHGVIMREFGVSVSELFATFDDEPLAGASITQVHRATLSSDYRPVVGGMLPAGAAVAVKVVRPGVEATILRDIEALRPLARFLARTPRFSRYDLIGLLEEFTESLRSECDLRREGRVADRFAFDFSDDPVMVVPRVVWTRTARSVLTTEFIEGWRLSELGEAESKGVDARRLAEHGSEVFLRQVLELGRFHADLHPANIFVTPDSRICYLDFGITGRTSPEQRIAIAQVLAATVYGDAERAVRYSARLGLIIPGDRRAEIERRVAGLMERTLSRPPRDIRGFAVGFLGILESEHVNIPVGYGLLIKALVTVEGVARALYPEIDITDTAGPYATRIVASWALRPDKLEARVDAAIRAALNEFVS
jgi:ubiquinone biosynthesis protein